MAPTSSPITISGNVVNLQIIHGGRPTINNFAHPSETHRSARSTLNTSRSPSSRSRSPHSRSSHSRSPSVSSAASSRSTLPMSPREHHTSPSPMLFPSPDLEFNSSSASLLPSIGSPMEYLNGFQTSLITRSSRRLNPAENLHIGYSPSSAAYCRSNAGDLRFYSHEIVDNNQSRRSNSTADLYGSTERVSFPTPCLPSDSFPGPSANSRHVWSMPRPDRCVWVIDEEDEDYFNAYDQAH